MLMENVKMWNDFVKQFLIFLKVGIWSGSYILHLLLTWIKYNPSMDK